MRSHLIYSLCIVNYFKKIFAKIVNRIKFAIHISRFVSFRYLISQQYPFTALFDKLFGCIIRKVRSSAEYLQAVCRGPRNCINFSNKTKSYKFAAGNIVRKSSVPRRGVINFGSHETIRASSKSFPHFRKPMRNTNPRNSRPVFVPIIL